MDSLFPCDSYIPFDETDIEKAHMTTRQKRVRRASLFFPGDPPPAPIEWVVDGLVQRGSLTVVAGPPGSGKSAAVLSGLLADGGPWLGRKVDAGPALWLGFEAADSTRRRLMALDPDEHAQVCIERAPPNLLDVEAFEDIDGILDEADYGFGRPVEIVVVDALASAMRTGDENSIRDVGKALGVLLKLAERRDLTVILIHHTGKSSDALPRGHSSIIADAASVLSIVGGRLTTIKQRDAQPLPGIPFRIIDRNGVPDVVLAEDGDAGASRHDRLTPDAAAVLAVIRKVGRPAPWMSLRDEFADALRGVKPRNPDAIKQALSNAKRWLVANGYITLEGDIVSVSERKRDVSAYPQALPKDVSENVSAAPPLGGALTTLTPKCRQRRARAA